MYTAGNIGAAFDPATQTYKGPGVGIVSEYKAPADYTAATFSPDKADFATFDAATRDAYMSPYMSGVVDPAMREAKRQAGLAGLAEAARFTQSGAFGGARNVLAGAERERNLATQLGDIYGKGQQEAFLNAQQQFEREQARKLATQQFNIAKALEAGQLGEQSRQFGAGLSARSAEQAAQFGLQAQTATEAARQAAGQQALAAATTKAELAQRGQVAQEAARQAAGQQALAAATTQAELAQRGQVAQEAARQAAGQQALSAAQTAGQLGLQAATAQEAARQAAGQQALAAATTQAELAQRGQVAQEAARQAAGQQALSAAQTAGQLGLQAATAQEAAKQAAGQQALEAARTSAQYGLEASRLSEQAKQYAADLGLRTATTSAQYIQQARELQQRAEEAQARGNEFAASLLQNQQREALRAAEATRAFEYQQQRDKYLDPYRELTYAQSLLSGLPTSAGGNAGTNPSLAALLTLLSGNQIFNPTTSAKSSG